MLTGRSIRFGNFSALPRRRLESLVVVSEFWNHYAAAVFKSRQPFVTVPTRATRLSGNPQMNFIRLVVTASAHLGLQRHDRRADARGLAGADRLPGVGPVATLAIRLVTTLAIPGWATTPSASC